MTVWFSRTSFDFDEMPPKVITVAALTAKYAPGDAYVGQVLKGRPEKKLLFAIISKGRPGNVRRLENELKAGGVAVKDIVWVVGAGEGKTYHAEGQVHEGGGLCKSRNLAIDLAVNYDYCVQLSDDMAGNKGAQVMKFENKVALDLFDAFSLSDKNEWNKKWKPELSAKKSQDMTAPPTCNDFARDNLVSVSVPGAAKLVAGVLEGHGTAKLAGVTPTANAGLYAGSVPVGTDNFIVGDFLVIDTTTTVRFDERMTLKEDYYFTAQNLLVYKEVVRLNKVFLEFRHYDNDGGAVDVRGKPDKDIPNPIEQRNINFLRHTFPGAFRTNPQRGINEIIFNWSQRSREIGGRNNIKREPLLDLDESADNLPPAPASSSKKRKADDLPPNQKKITSFFAAVPSSRPPKTKKTT